MVGQDIPLSTLSLLRGGSLSENGSLITFAGQDSGFVVFGPYLPIKAGLYTFVIEIKFPWHLVPRAFIDIFGDGVVYSLQRISTHCNTVHIQAFVSADCKLEVRLYSERTPFELKRISYFSGADKAVPYKTRVQPRSTLLQLLDADGVLGAPQAWAEPTHVAQALFGDNHFQVLPVQSLNEHEGILRQAGIMPAIIQAFFHQNNFAGMEGNTSVDDLMGGEPRLLTNVFQQEIAAAGHLEFISPYDGSVIRTRTSIPVSNFRSVLPIFYEFPGECPIVVGVGTGWTGALSCIWFVKHDIIIYDNVGNVDWLGTEQVIAQYLAFCVTHAQQVSAYRKTTQNRTVAVAAGFNSNMGHYFWNETSGIERLIRSNRLTKVEKIYSPRVRWLTIADIFDADQLPPFVTLDDWQELSDEVLTRNQLLVHPTGTRYDDRLALKVIEAAKKRFSVEAPERWQSAKALSSGGEYVLYVNLRTHNKAWIEQDEGIIEIVRTLCSFYGGDIIVYLDGYQDCESSVKKIISTTIDRVTYVIGIMGWYADFPETLYWAFRCDFFVAVIGSGLVPLTWLANKPGICYGDRDHLSQMNFWQRIRYNTAAVGWPAADHIRDVSGLTDHANYSHANYSIDPAYMVQLFRDVWTRTRSEDAGKNADVNLGEGEDRIDSGTARRLRKKIRALFSRAKKQNN